MKAFSALDRQSDLFRSIDEAMNELKLDPTKGERVEQRLWPKKYVKKYDINNLYRYRLIDGWRLTYTIIGNNDGVVSVVLDALNHTAYDRLFGYDTR